MHMIVHHLSLFKKTDVLALAIAMQGEDSESCDSNMVARFENVDDVKNVDDVESYH